MATKVVVRKLGREKALGLAYKEHDEIHLDKRLKGKEFISVALHELLHIHFPELTEAKVNSVSIKMAKVLWDLKLRRLDV